MSAALLKPTLRNACYSPPLDREIYFVHVLVDIEEPDISEVSDIVDEVDAYSEVIGYNWDGIFSIKDLFSSDCWPWHGSPHRSNYDYKSEAFDPDRSPADWRAFGTYHAIYLVSKTKPVIFDINGTKVLDDSWTVETGDIIDIRFKDRELLAVKINKNHQMDLGRNASRW